MGLVYLKIGEWLGSEPDFKDLTKFIIVQKQAGTQRHQPGGWRKEHRKKAGMGLFESDAIKLEIRGFRALIAHEERGNRQIEMSLWLGVGGRERMEKAEFRLAEKRRSPVMDKCLGHREDSVCR